LLKIENLSFSYQTNLVLKNIQLQVHEGTCVALMGPSGCGKSTLLEIIYGLHDVKANLSWKEQPILGPAYHLVPGMPYMKYVSQHFDLMPFITVAENVGKYVSNLDWQYKQKRVLELLQLVHMEEYANVKAKLLSGGQMQRVAIARALAQMPEVILLDEPFSHVDTALKNQLRRNLFAFFKENNITCVIATHDKEDVLPFADEIIILNSGNILQKGTPKEVFYHPITTSVASLFGDVYLVPSLIQEKYNLPEWISSYQLKLSQEGIKATIKKINFHGNFYQYFVDIDGSEFSFFSTSSFRLKEKVILQFSYI
jgi:ABC-type Fe3+/spermidine/putrescine transport system ATPase subunit